MDIESPGLVEDGTRCGDGLVCQSQQCVSVTTTPQCSTGSNGQVCSGNGVSSSVHFCHTWPCTPRLVNALYLYNIDLPIQLSDNTSDQCSLFYRYVTIKELVLATSVTLDLPVRPPLMDQEVLFHYLLYTL